MIKKLFWCLPILLIPACSVLRISDGQFTVFRASFGNKTTLGHLQAGHGENKISLDQYSNDQVEALGVITAAAIGAAIKGAKTP